PAQVVQLVLLSRVQIIVHSGERRTGVLHLRAEEDFEELAGHIVMVADGLGVAFLGMNLPVQAGTRPAAAWPIDGGQVPQPPAQSQPLAQAPPARSQAAK